MMRHGASEREREREREREIRKEKECVVCECVCLGLKGACEQLEILSLLYILNIVIEIS